MRFPLTLFWMALGLLFLAPDHSAGGIQRRKRFLSADSWALIPDRLDEILARASQRISARLAPLHTAFHMGPVDEYEDLRPAASSVKDSERELETEDPESEVIVEKPRRKLVPQRPAIYNPFADPLGFSFGLFTPWWNGPNICTERTEIDEPAKDIPGVKISVGLNNYMEFSHCQPTESSYSCTRRVIVNDTSKTTVIKKQCCHGFVRRTDGKPGCVAVEMDNVLQTMRNLEASKFAEIVESTSLVDKLKSENFTAFAPVDEAVTDFEEEAENNEILAVRPAKNKDMSYFAGGHIIDGFVNLDDLEDEKILPAINGRTSIRINKYRLSKVTANCVPVSRKNKHATNGFVHLVSDILPLPRKSVGDVISGAPHFRMFVKLLEQSDLLDKLRNPENSWTVFAPSDAAFKEMDQELLRKLESGEGCLESILYNHVAKGTVCSSAIVGQGKVRNLLGKHLTVTRDELETVKIEGAKVNSTDVLGTNGVVHIIDEVLIPSEARDITAVLEDAERTDFLELIDTAKLKDAINDMKNITFFVPSREALQDIPKETMKQWKENPDQLQEILMFHLTQPRTPITSFTKLPVLKTKTDSEVRVRVHEMFPGIVTSASVQCSRVTSADNEACGASIHVIDKVMIPPKKNVLEALKATKNHDTFRKMLEGTELESTLESKDQFTILTPTDEAFERFDKKTLEDLLSNKTKAQQILKMHILPETLCCNNVHHSFPFGHHYVRTMEGNLIPIHRSRHNRVHFGQARTVQCEAGLGQNGIVHSINKVLLPTSRRRNPPFFELEVLRLF